MPSNEDPSQPKNKYINLLKKQSARKRTSEWWEGRRRERAPNVRNANGRCSSKCIFSFKTDEIKETAETSQSPSTLFFLFCCGLCWVFIAAHGLFVVEHGL